MLLSSQNVLELLLMEIVSLVVLRFTSQNMWKAGRKSLKRSKPTMGTYSCRFGMVEEPLIPIMLVAFKHGVLHLLQ